MPTYYLSLSRFLDELKEKLMLLEGIFCGKGIIVMVRALTLSIGRGA